MEIMQSLLAMKHVMVLDIPVHDQDSHVITVTAECQRQECVEVLIVDTYMMQMEEEMD